MHPKMQLLRIVLKGCPRNAPFELYGPQDPVFREPSSMPNFSSVAPTARVPILKTQIHTHTHIAKYIID